VPRTIVLGAKLFIFEKLALGFGVIIHRTVHRTDHSYTYVYIYSTTYHLLLFTLDMPFGGRLFEVPGRYVSTQIFLRYPTQQKLP
jgi:hypothetical protein